MIPLVAASEEGKAQAESDRIRIVEYEVPVFQHAGKVFLERSALEGDSPVFWPLLKQHLGLFGVVLLGNAVRMAGIPLPRLNITGRPIAHK